MSDTPKGSVQHSAGKLLFWASAFLSFLLGALLLASWDGTLARIFGELGRVILLRPALPPREDVSPITIAVSTMFFTWPLLFRRSAIIGALGALAAWAPALICIERNLLLTCGEGVTYFPLYCALMSVIYLARKGIPQERWYQGVILGFAAIVAAVILAVLMVGNYVVIILSESIGNVLAPGVAVVWFLWSSIEVLLKSRIKDAPMSDESR